MVEREVTGDNAWVERTDSADFVFYQVHHAEAAVHFTFEKSLPHMPDTETARSLLKLAGVQFQLKQPYGIGGSLSLLDTGPLRVEDFERFEVQAGQLKWRLVRTSEWHYRKPLQSSDADCFTGDIAGRCACEFTGPAITVTIDGSLPLQPDVFSDPCEPLLTQLRALARARACAVDSDCHLIGAYEVGPSLVAPPTGVFVWDQDMDLAQSLIEDARERHCVDAECALDGDTFRARCEAGNCMAKRVCCSCSAP